MPGSTKLAKFVNILAILLVIFSIIDIAYFVFTLNIGLSLIKSLGTLCIAIFLYLSINKPALFNANT